MWIWGWNPQKPTKLDGNDTTIVSQHRYILCHFDIHAMNNVILTKWHRTLSINPGVLENRWRIASYLCCLCLDYCNNFSCCHATVMQRVRSQRINDLLILVTCRSGISVILCGKLNGPVAHGSTRQCLIWIIEGLWLIYRRHFTRYGSQRPLTNLTHTFQMCSLCTFNVAAIYIFFLGGGASLHMTYYHVPW